MISNLHKNKSYTTITTNLEIPEIDYSGSSLDFIGCIPFEDRDYPVRCHHRKNLNENSHLLNSIRTKSTTTRSKLSHLSTKEPELDELLELVGRSVFLQATGEEQEKRRTEMH